MGVTTTEGIATSWKDTTIKTLYTVIDIGPRGIYCSLRPFFDWVELFIGVKLTALL